MLRRGVDVKHVRHGGCNLLQQLCARTDDVSAFVAAILRGAPGVDVNEADADTERTALHFAAQHNGHEAVLEALLRDPRVDVNAADYRERRALHLASRWSTPRCVARLLQAPGCDAECRDVEGNGAVHYAAMANNVGALRELLQSGHAALSADAANKSGV